MMCLHSAVDLLLRDSTALVFWIDAHSGGFSAQLASDFSRARIQQLQLDQGQDIEVCGKRDELCRTNGSQNVSPD